MSLPAPLIKANIALFQGERAETQRLLQEYIGNAGTVREDDPNRSLVLWLDAQIQTNLDERLRRLNALVATIDADDPYARLSREYLQEEERYRAKIAPQAQQRPAVLAAFGAPLWKAGLFVIVGGMAAWILLSLFSGANRPASPADSTGAAPTGMGSNPAMGANLPDESRPLVADSYTARYRSGVLQIVAVEDDSKRVVDGRSLTLITPVPGARFLALSAVFECRDAICGTPPEAELSLRLDNEITVAARVDVSIAGERVFEPIALGRTTAGWIIFEIPVISAVNALIITPIEEPGGTPEPVVITLEMP